MNRWPGLIPETIPKEIRQRVVAACERFESAWRAGDRPAIEPYLDGLGTVERAAALHGLVALEFKLRCDEHDPPTLKEYVNRFPGDATVVETAVATSNYLRAGDAPANGTPPAPSVEGTEFVATASGVGESTIGIAGCHGSEDRRKVVPLRLGRYEVVRLLGEGSFGSVYLARDGELGRDVAIKVPTTLALTVPGQLEALRAEARLAAVLRHPAIVGVYDVGRDDDGSVFIVLEYVEGTTLADLLELGPVEAVRLAGLIASIADAVHHAHSAGLVHRDLKPANIMIDKLGKPRVADFGLAITEDVQPDRAGEVAGTPAYMAPEQVRGEAHRLDGRTDIWAIGVILYHGLTGRLPFHAGDRSALFDEILHRDPKPPRQIDDSIPHELERICLRCLCKRMPDRYSSSIDVADDVRAWLSVAASPAAGTGQSADGLRPGEDSPPGAAEVVPRGLRAFDKQDSEAFLDLLPGPRGRGGVPDSICFWKTRIEDRDGDPAQSVGLLYGPSGCGKSSLIKAGLLPRLANSVVSVFVEATPADTERRIAAGVAARCQGLSTELALSELLTAIRRGQGLGGERKLLIVVDQFEQWLQANDITENTELVRALRQCDGARVHALLIVRDDFWMSVTRFFRMLDVRLSEDANCTAVELFDLHHAEVVLAAFGRAFGILPRAPGQPIKDQQAFITESISELSQKGQVIPVHLSVFAEMVKGQAWTPVTLHDVGGSRGLGVKFLDKAFGDGAPPYRRIHQRAAREVLDRLLPASGVDIKGRVHSRSELLVASGYAEKLDDFEELVRVLDSEMKLVTPVDRSAVGGGEPHYQLTHDFLVPVLREWLAAQQRETMTGRAELRLAERAALWGDRHEPKQLPTIVEWLSIAVLTPHHRWAWSEREVMKAAGRHHLVRAAVVFIAGAAAVLAAAVGYGYYNAHALVERLLVAETSRVSRIVDDLGPFRPWANHALLAAANDSSRSSRERLHARLALLPAGLVIPQSLIEPLLVASPDEFRALLGMLSPHAKDLVDPLWTVVKSAELGRERRLRAACALATFDPNAAAWRRVAPEIATLLLGENPLLVNEWVGLLRPVGQSLIGPLADVSAELSDRGARRLATSILADYASADPQQVVDLIVNADPEQFVAYLPAVRSHREVAIPLLLARAAGLHTNRPIRRGPDSSEKQADTLARHRATAAVALLRLGRPDAAWPLLISSPDPRVQTETIYSLVNLGAAPDLLAERFLSEPDVSVRTSLLLALADCALRAPKDPWIGRTASHVLETYRNDPDPGIHAAARLLLRNGGSARDVRQFDDGLEGAAVRGQNRWFVDGGNTMVVINPIGRAPALSDGRSIDRIFAISSTETTLGQFLRFRPNHPYQKKLGTDRDYPVGVVSWYDAVAYCAWLDEECHVPVEERCYPPVDQIKEGMQMPRDYLRRTGHRLPTFAEWEYAARALTTTSRHYGERDGLLGDYAWFQGNSGDFLHPVGSLKPNALGLFDVYGSMVEWCQESMAFYRKELTRDVEDPSPATGDNERIIRSGAYNFEPGRLVSQYLGPISPVTQWDNIGFRIARTIKTEEQ
jgi:eukaryotic-like serine/threonine-protein kinase